MSSPAPDIAEIARLVASTALLADLSPGVRQRLAVILAAVLRENERLNLTAITDVGRAVVAHLADSLAGLGAAGKDLAAAGSAADVGAGAGFPCLVLAAAEPAVAWTAIESVAKKTRFIAAAANEAGLGNVAVMAARAEDAGRAPETRESFGLATARAVGCVAGLLEVGLPLLRVGGVLMLWKTTDALEEARAAEAVAVRLGGQFEAPHAYSLPGDEKGRIILRIRKVGPTPEEYPRRAGVPFRKPLG